MPWHLVVGLLLDDAAGTAVVSQKELKAALRSKVDSPTARMVQSRLSALNARYVLRAGKPRQAAKLARKALDEAAALGFEGVVVEAGWALAMAKRELVRDAWRSTAADALALASQLGRHVQAAQISALVSE